MWMWNGWGVLVQFSRTQSCSEFSGMHWSTTSPCSPNCLSLIMKWGGNPLLSSPVALLPASHWNFTGELGFVGSFLPGGFKSFRNFGISAHCLGNGPSAGGFTGVPSTLTKYMGVPGGFLEVLPDTNVYVPACVGAWTRTSARFPAASASPPGTMPFGAEVVVRNGWFA